MNQGERPATLTTAVRVPAGAADQNDGARLIDSHVHIWDPTVLEYSWLDGELDRPYLPAEYQAAAPAVTGFIFVEAGAAGTTDEVAWAESLGWPELLGVVAHAPLEQGSRVVTELAALREAGRTVGIRRLLQDEPLSSFEDEDSVGSDEDVAFFLVDFFFLAFGSGAGSNGSLASPSVRRRLTVPLSSASSSPAAMT